MIDIFQRTGLVAGIVFEKDLQIRQEDYRLVARVDSDSIGDAWNLTQNGAGNWVKAGEVEPLVEDECCRSSSIGDVFSVNGQLQVVLFEGYAPIEWGDTVTPGPSFLGK